MTTPTIYRATITPRWADVDANGHLRHSAYADWATFVRTEWLYELGLTLRKLTALRIVPITQEETTKYSKEILLGEKIEVDLALAGSSADASWFVHRLHFRRGETLCARYEMKGAWMDIEKRRIAAPPPDVVQAISTLARTSDYVDLE